MIKEGLTKFMVAREAFHAVRSDDTAAKYADAALAEKDFGNTPRGPVLAAIKQELTHAGYADAATRIKP